MDKQNQQINPKKIAVNTVISFMNKRNEAMRKYRKLITEEYGELKSAYKYIATIAAGAAALSPHLYEFVLVPTYFFIGVSFELLCVTIALVYLLGITERRINRYDRDRYEVVNEMNKLIEEHKKFIQDPDAGIVEYLALWKSTDKKISENVKIGDPQDRKSYFTESLLFTFLAGAIFLILSLTGLCFVWYKLVILAIILFTAILLMAKFSERFFVWVGWPIEWIIKHISPRK